MCRGMDFKGVNLVVNYDFPNSDYVYIHRIGNRACTVYIFREGNNTILMCRWLNSNGIAHILKVTRCQVGPVPRWMMVDRYINIGIHLYCHSGQLSLLHWMKNDHWLRGVRSFVCSFVRSFVIAGSGPAYSGPQHWDLVQCTSPGEEGNWLVCMRVCMTCRVKEGLSIGVNSLSGISIAYPL